MKKDIELQRMYLCKDYTNLVDYHFPKGDEERVYSQMIRVFFLIKEGKYVDAEEALATDVNAKLTDSSLFYLNLILLGVKEELFDLDKIDSYIEKGLASSDLRGKRWMYLELFKIYASEKIDYARLMLQKSLEIEPDFLPSLLEEACLIDFYEEPQKVISMLEKLKGQINCPVAMLLNSLGNAYLVQGDWKSAKLCFEESLEVEVIEESCFGLAMIYHFYDANPNFEQAIKYYEMAIDANPYYYEVRVGYLALLSEMGGKIKFQKMLQETIDVESNSFGALLDIIFMLVEEGEYESISDVIPSLVALENSFDVDYLMLLIDFKKRGVSFSEAQESLNRIENHIQRNLFETIVKRMYFYDEL